MLKNLIHSDPDIYRGIETTLFPFGGREQQGCESGGGGMPHAKLGTPLLGSSFYFLGRKSPTLGSRDVSQQYLQRGGGVEKITFAVSFSTLKRYFRTEVILHCLA